MIEKLNEILKWEYAGLVQYTQFSFLVQDTWREVYYKFFRENGEEASTMLIWSVTRSQLWAACQPWSAARSSNQATCMKCSSTLWKSRASRSSSTPKRSSSAAKRKWVCACCSKTSAPKSRKVWTTSKKLLKKRELAIAGQAQDRPAESRLIEPDPTRARRTSLRGGSHGYAMSPRIYRGLSAIAGGWTSHHSGAGPGKGIDGTALRRRASSTSGSQTQDSLKLLKLPRIQLEPPLVEPADPSGVMLLSQVDQQTARHHPAPG